MSDIPFVFYKLQMNRLFSRVGFYFALVLAMWYTIEITGSVFLTGLVAFSLTISGLISSPLSGHILDRFHDIRIVVYSTLGELISYLFMGLMIMHILPFFTLYPIMGVIYFMMTIGSMASYVFTPNIVAEDKLLKANSVGEISLTISEGVGAILGGSLLYLIGSYSLIIISISTLLFLALILVIRFHRDNILSNVRKERSEDISGWSETFVFVKSKLLMIVIFSTALNALLIIMDVLGAPLIKETLNSSSMAYGFYTGTFSIGGLVGALMIGKLKPHNLWLLVFLYFAVSGFSFLIMGMVHILLIVVLLPFFIGVMASVSNIPL
ncbi:MAG: MFS transporter, partial [Candidatus Thermoplasmatota archaeon]|nr:MFS transporter [Candidatus Thermoplasmatota archaeon]